MRQLRRLPPDEIPYFRGSVAKYGGIISAENAAGINGFICGRQYFIHTQLCVHTWSTADITLRAGWCDDRLQMAVRNDWRMLHDG